MTPDQRIVIDELTAAAREQADAHYAAVHAVYLEKIPAFLRPEDPDSLLKRRPPGFSADASEFIFFLKFGEFYARTFVVFHHKPKKSPLWYLHRFVSQVGGDPFSMRQAVTRALPAALLVASEMFAEAQSGGPQNPGMMGSQVVQ